MGTTPVYAIPYVEPSDALANFPVADKAQADAVEAALVGQTPGQWCDLVANAVQAMASSTETLINLNTGIQQPAGQWASGSNVKILAAGLYQVVLTYSFASNATGSRIVLLKANGVSARGWNVGGAATVANITGTITMLRRFSVNDTVAMAQYQSSGSSLNTFNQAYPGIALSRLGA